MQITGIGIKRKGDKSFTTIGEVECVWNGKSSKLFIQKKGLNLSFSTSMRYNFNTVHNNPKR